ncbi:MAG: adenine phosphoribosyltransferase [Planctomycetota bacterium]
MQALETYIRDVPDFPKPGIVFKDITPLLGNADGFRATVTALAERARPLAPDMIVAIESRGFIFGAALALTLGRGLVPVRKPGKLPAATLSETYDLEYGQDRVEIHRDALLPGQRALVVDDLIATGGTLAATCKLVEKLGARVVGCLAIIELTFLNGRHRLGSRHVETLITY